MTIAVIVDPAVAMAMHDVRAADLVADDTADYGAHWPSNYGSSASADGDAFRLPGLRRKRDAGQRCHNY